MQAGCYYRSRCQLRSTLPEICLHEPEGPAHSVCRRRDDRRDLAEATRDPEHGLNLSLGTVKPHNITVLTDAVRRAAECGTIIVSAREHDGEPWYPGSLPLVAGVVLDWTCPREAIRLEATEENRLLCAGSGYPRPVPGIPPERNLKGVSFSVANVSGLLACLLETEPKLRSVASLTSLLCPA